MDVAMLIDTINQSKSGFEKNFRIAIAGAAFESIANCTKKT